MSPWESVYFSGNCTDQPSRTDRLTHACRKLTEIRVERHLAVDSQRSYPVCVGGRRASPPEDCGGALAYMQLVEAHRLNPPWEEIRTITEAFVPTLGSQR